MANSTINTYLVLVAAASSSIYDCLLCSAHVCADGGAYASAYRVEEMFSVLLYDSWSILSLNLELAFSGLETIKPQ